MNFWTLMIKKDDWIISIVEHLRFLKGPFCWKSFFYYKKKTYPNGKGKDIYIILNAPSLKTQDLSVLNGRCTMFVNRGFMHPLYKQLQPNYHIFIDTKMLNGIWPISWLEEIWVKSPVTKIILPAAWSYNHLFKKYRNSDKIIWAKFHLPFYNLGVSGACFSFAIQQKYDNIFFTGFDANGIGYELVESANSHFYGNDKELEGRTTEQFALGLYMHSRHLHDLNRLANYCKIRNISIVNITNGGLLDMFPRKNILPIIKD